MHVENVGISVMSHVLLRIVTWTHGFHHLQIQPCMLASKLDSVNFFVRAHDVINHLIDLRRPLSCIEHPQGWRILDRRIQSAPELPQKFVRGSGTRRYLLQNERRDFI